jgi:glycosyltransferase involved in cell wall biosynthesis
VPYKRFDLLVETFKANGRKLKIFGDGPDFNRLKDLAGEATNIEFLGRVSNEAQIKLYSEAQAFINPQEEDFGITMVESLASGRPVIAFNKGGAREIVEVGINGLLFDEQTSESLNQVLLDFDKNKFDGAAIKQGAEKFSVAKFKSEINRIIEDRLAKLKAE